jgi:hypothetical protein
MKNGSTSLYTVNVADLIPDDQATRFHLRVLRVLRPFAFLVAVAPSIRKSSSFLPPFIAAASHRGFNPRPAQLSLSLSGLRYFGATFPRAPRPKADLGRPAPPRKRASLESSDSSVRRCSTTLALITASTCPRRLVSWPIDIDFRFIPLLQHLLRVKCLISFNKKKKAPITRCVGAADRAGRLRISVIKVCGVF